MPLPNPPCDPEGCCAWVERALDGLYEGEVRASTRFRGGQTDADAALASLDVSGYARRRNEVWPPGRRGASGLSPWIRHGLLPLPRVWSHVADGPSRDVSKFRDELLWQEYARHLYARLGGASRRSLRLHPVAQGAWHDPWPRDMRCIEASLDELERDGWLVNQVRMWLASQWTVRGGAPWREGEDRFFRHLLDGSRAANRLGWQWTVGSGSAKSYGFSRWQVEKRAPALCRECSLRGACPIQDWPRENGRDPVPEPPTLALDPDLPETAGPLERVRQAEPEAVWLTAESLGDADPALAGNPALPAIFVFDEPLLRRLRLSAKRLVFMAECLADLATRRSLEIHRGSPESVLQGRALAATFTPVPGWRRIASRIRPAEVRPWPWLRRPHAGSLRSFSAWRRGLPASEATGVGPSQLRLPAS